MYRTISQVPKEAVRNLRKSNDKNRIVFRDVMEADFKKANYCNGKIPFTMKNLISELKKIPNLPNYTLFPTEDKKIRIFFYERVLSVEENQKVKELLREMFGIGKTN